MAEKRRGLGRGLGALISGTPSTEGEEGVRAESVSETGASRSDPDLREAPQQVDEEQSSPVSNDDVPRETEQNRPAGASEAKLSDQSQRGGSGLNTSSSTGKGLENPKPRQQTKSTGKSASRKSRPVDMFFTPGASEKEAGEVAAPSAAKQRQSSGARNRRVAVPDVLGQVMQAKDGAGDDPKPASSASPVELSGKSIDVPEAREDSASSSSTEDEVSRETLVSVPGARFAEISVDNIHPNRKQPRNVFDEDDMAELVHSIREVGLLQPIVVRPSEEEDGEEFELVMGERRWRAVQAANLPTIPAIIRDTPNTDLLRDALLENLHRSQLNPLEEAAAYQQLMQEFDCTQEELSARIGRSRPQISNTIRLMKLPALVQRRVAAGVLSSGHARALLGLADVAEMEKLAQRVVNEGLSVRATEEIVSMNDGLRRPTRDKKPRATARHERLDYLANSLSDQLDTNVKITLGAKKGRVSIEFGSVEDLNRIMGVISPGAPQ